MNRDDAFPDRELPAREREQLAQELLELHFGCHEAPEQLTARLAAEPALRALQQQVLAEARAMELAAKPATPEVRLQPPERRRWRLLRSSGGRMLAASAVAASILLGLLIAAELAERAHDAFRRERLHLTVSAPQAVPAGAPWSFTVQTRDLAGRNVDAAVTWEAFADDGAMLATAQIGVRDGLATIAPPVDARLQMPSRILVTAQTATDRAQQLLNLSTAAAGPLVHLHCDRPVYRPGEPVFARAVVLDRITRLPLAFTPLLRATLRNSRGVVVAVDQGLATSGVGSFRMMVPEDSAGGPHTLRLEASDRSLPPETIELVVRSFETPRLAKRIELDRSSYQPGGRGSATVRANRLGGDGAPAAAANVTAKLVIDGSEVWTTRQVLDADGATTFAFTLPTSVDKGAGRFVATIEDGGTVETELKPFLVPTGKVQVGFFPEGGELVAGVDNAVYAECADPLGRPVDAAGELIDGRGRSITRFRTLHQGRGKVVFRPARGERYALRLVGHPPFDLPPVQERGLAMQLRGDDIAADAPMRLQLAGRGDGPWLLGVFCRGAMVGQTTLQPSANGELAAAIELPLPPTATGVLRATVFDRSLQPVAERLLRRLPRERLSVELACKQPQLSPGEPQQVAITVRDEAGAGRRAVVGVGVSDAGALAMGSEPAIGLVDHALLFADVEKTENLGDFLLANTKSAAHVDLLLGTRGWRRFVWRNDAAAQKAIAARGPEADGVLAREGFSHMPQVASNLAAAQAGGSALANSAASAQQRLQTAGPLALLALLLLLLAESAVRIVRGPRRVRWLPMPILAAVVVFLVMLLQLRTLGGRLAPGADFAPVAAPAAAPMQLSRRTAPESAFDSNSWNSAVGLSAAPRYAGFDNFGARDLLYDEFDSGRLVLGRSGFLPIPVVGSRAQLPQFPPQPRNLQDQQARRVRHYAHQHSPSEERSDFTPTIYWNTMVVTDEAGRAEIGFGTSDAVTTWRVRADAHVDAHVEVAAGRLGQGTAEFQTRLPLQVELKLPDEVAAGDQLLLPIAAEVVDPTQTEVALTLAPAGGLHLLGDAPATIALQQGRGRALLRFAVADQVGSATLTVTAKAGRFTDVLQRRIRISPRGFPQRRSFAGMATTSIPGMTTLTLPASALAGSGRATLKVFPSPLSTLLAGLDGMLQEPHGCFEQTSSTNYPNTLVLALLERSGEHAPAAAGRARELLAKGYQRLLGFECKRGGFEWFGKDPGHEALTAYGLLQFHDMARVSDVDAAMLLRTRQWLLGRRNGSGDFVHDGTDHHSFGRSQPVTNAWCTMALLQTGTPADQLGRELTALVARMERADAYELAVIATALQLADRGEAVAARQRLAGMQQPDGSLRGATSLTQSGGTDLLVETTSLALLAWLPDPARSGNVQQALEFIQRCRRANGTFGASQATVCALRAIVGYVDATKPSRSDGTLIVRSGERELLRASYAANATEPLEFALWPLLGPGEHSLRLEVEGKDSPASLPWSLDVTYCAEQPADDPQAPVHLATTLRRMEVQEGDTVALDLELRNTTDAEVPTPIAVIGLPAGCELPTRVLDDLARAEAFAAWELTGRTLVLYWRRLLPGERRQLTLDLIGRVPGATSGPASRCTPYYSPDAVHWAAPLSLKVTPR